MDACTWLEFHLAGFPRLLLPQIQCSPVLQLSQLVLVTLIHLVSLSYGVWTKIRFAPFLGFHPLLSRGFPSARPTRGSQANAPRPLDVRGDAALEPAAGGGDLPSLAASHGGRDEINDSCAGSPKGESHATEKKTGWAKRTRSPCSKPSLVCQLWLGILRDWRHG